MDNSVVIVGAGPVGLTLAAELARFGIAVRIVDKAAQRSQTSKALVLWSRSLEALDRSGCGAALVAAGRKVTAAAIFAGGEQIAHIGLDHIDSPYNYALMLPQSETERILDAHLAARGIEVERSVEMTRLVPAATGVLLDLSHPDGRVEPVRCGWVVGCDGAHSAVRHALGMPFAGETLPSDWILADVHLTGLPVPDDELCLFWHADGVLAFFPIAPGRYRIIADVGDGKLGAKPRDPSLAEVQALVDGRGPGGVAVSDPIWMSGFRINERKVADYRLGRVFLAGDAAHVHSPAGGQGMNTGMQDAANLAWKLALVVRGEASAEPLLSSYSAERSAVGDMVLTNAGRLTALALVRNPALQSIRNHLAHAVFGLERVRDRMAETLSETTIRYEHSPLVVRGSGHGGPASGEPLPVTAGSRPIGTGDAPRFALLAEPGPDAADLAAQFPRLVDPVLRPPPHTGGIWLVRPDGYVAVATGADGWREIAIYLHHLAA